MSALAILKILEFIVEVASRAGINIARFHEMRAASGGRLSDEQRTELLREAHDAVERM